MSIYICVILKTAHKEILVIPSKWCNIIIKDALNCRFKEHKTYKVFFSADLNENHVFQEGEHLQEEFNDNRGAVYEAYLLKFFTDEQEAIDYCNRKRRAFPVDYNLRNCTRRVFNWSLRTQRTRSASVSVLRNLRKNTNRNAQHVNAHVYNPRPEFQERIVQLCASEVATGPRPMAMGNCVVPPTTCTISTQTSAHLTFTGIRDTKCFIDLTLDMDYRSEKEKLQNTIDLLNKFIPVKNLDFEDDEQDREMLIEDSDVNIAVNFECLIFRFKNSCASLYRQRKILRISSTRNHKRVHHRWPWMQLYSKS